MQPSPTDKAQISFLLPDLERQLDPRNALFRLARLRGQELILDIFVGKLAPLALQKPVQESL